MIGDGDQPIVQYVDNINAYLIPSENIIIQGSSRTPTDRAKMQFGNHPYYATPLIFSVDDAHAMIAKATDSARFIRPFFGSKEFIDCSPRACLWIKDEDADEALNIDVILERVTKTAQLRRAAKNDKSAQKLADTPYRFREQITADRHTLVVPRVSSENRPYLPVGILTPDAIIQEKAFALYDAPLWNMALIASRLHWVWIGTVCVRLEMRFSYSNTLGWNTFPVPLLTEKNKADLTRCAEDILLTREAHFPATIADLYDPDTMPADLRAAHDRNDEVLERIYIGRRFKNDTERLEKLFEMYTQMTQAKAGPAKPPQRLDMH